MYVPNEVLWGDSLSTIIRFIIKVTTPVKLNLTNKEGQTLITEEDAIQEDEVHFVQLEAIHKEFRVDWSLPRSIWNMRRSKNLVF